MDSTSPKVNWFPKRFCCVLFYKLRRYNLKFCLIGDQQVKSFQLLEYKWREGRFETNCQLLFMTEATSMGEMGNEMDFTTDQCSRCPGWQQVNIDKSPTQQRHTHWTSKSTIIMGLASSCKHNDLTNHMMYLGKSKERFFCGQADHKGWPPPRIRKKIKEVNEYQGR